MNLRIFIIVFLMVSCTNNESNNQGNILGNWQLEKYEDAEEGTILPPNDGKPIQMNFKSGEYEGLAGNNEIHGDYRTDDGKLIFTLTTTEINNTEWELQFKGAIEKKRQGNQYIMKYSLNGNELTFSYAEQSTMYFKKI